MILLQQYVQRMRREQRASPIAQFGSSNVSQGDSTEKRDRNYSAEMGTRTMTAVALEATDSDDQFRTSQKIIPR